MRPLWPFFSASNYATDSLCLLKGECLHATQSRRCFSPRAHCVNKKQAEPMFEKFNRRDSSAEDSTSLEINFQSQQQQAGEPIKQGTTGPGGNNNPERACTWARTHIHTHSDALFPLFSSPVAQNNGVEANHQAATNTRGLQISGPVPGPACQHCTAGRAGICTHRRSAARLKSLPCHHLQLHCPSAGPRRSDKRQNTENSWRQERRRTRVTLQRRLHPVGGGASGGVG